MAGQESADSAHYIGVDIGGTKILATVFDKSLVKTSRRKKKTSAFNGAESVVESVVACIRDAIARGNIQEGSLAGIGVTVPGVFERATGTIISTPNLPFENYPLQKHLEDAFGAPVLIENDVNAGTYGEYRAGAARGFKNVIGIFPGTGIGGGLILDGKLYIGASGNAGEIGHMIIQVEGPLCGCGQYGCLEALASRTAMAKDAVSLASAGSAPASLEIAGTDFSAYSSKLFSRAPMSGDKDISRIVERSAWFLGIGMANCVNLLSPDVIVIGGGLVDRIGDEYLRAAEESMRQHAMPGISKCVRVVQADLGDDAASFGVAALCMEHEQT